MYASIAYAIKYVSMDNRRRPIAIAKDMSELRYRHLLLARTTVAWYSGRSRREEVILSSVCLYVSDAHSLTAGGRSTRLGEEFYAVSQTISCVTIKYRQRMLPLTSFLLYNRPTQSL